MGIREWMLFPDPVREKLLDMDYRDWSSEVERMIPSYGQTMAESAKKAFEDGTIERRHYLLLASSTGGGGG